MKSVVVFALVVAFAGCQLEDEQVGTTAQPQLMLNQLMLNQLMLNALLGHPTTLQLLGEYPLHTDSFDPDLGGSPWLSQQLLDPDAVQVMHYLTGCALDSKQSVEWTHPDTAELITFHGAEGLCPAWHDGPPTQACQELVSACLLARNNAFGQTVATSHRGTRLDGSAIPLAPRVNVTSVNQLGATLDSFEPCTETAGTSTGAGRSCGFDVAQSFVGTCQPGTVSWLYCGANASELSVRVCDGWRGCEAASDSALAAADHLCTQPIAFDCPARGSFSVMVGPYQAGTKASGDVQAYNATYPASEGAIFDVREGAFYGNLFTPSKRNSSALVFVDNNGVLHEPQGLVPGPVFLDLWACHAPEFTYGEAYLAKRICAQVELALGGVQEMCAATSVGPCHAVGWSWSPDTCSKLDAPPVAGDGDHDGCADEQNKKWYWPVTIYLDQPCDAVGGRPLAACRYRPTRTWK